MDHRKLAGMARKADRAMKLKTEIGKLTVDLDEIKKCFKKFAADTEVRQYEGKVGIVDVIDDSTTTADATKFYNSLESAGLTVKDFLNCVTVKITDTRDLLGKSMFAKISKTVPKPFSKVIIKPVK